MDWILQVLHRRFLQALWLTFTQHLTPGNYLTSNKQIMNFRNILKEIEQADPKIYEQTSGRREILKSFGAKVAVAALPLAVSSLFVNKKAYGKTTDTIIGTLNFALQISYFQYNFNL